MYIYLYIYIHIYTYIPKDACIHLYTHMNDEIGGARRSGYRVSRVSRIEGDHLRLPAIITCYH